MRFFQVLNFIKKPGFILGLIVLTFFLKGVFLATLMPFVHGLDEPKHYNTVQLLAKQSEKGSRSIKGKSVQDQDKLESYHLTEEIQETARATSYNQIRYNSYSTQSFSNGFEGEEEKKISSGKFSRLNVFIHPSIINTTRLYHYLGSLVEKFFSGESIFVRFYAVRIYSVILGSFCVLLFYFIAKNAGLSEKNSLLISAIAAFHPMLAQTSAFITYDVLTILAFTLFTFAGVLILKKGLNFLNSFLIIASLIIGIATKGTALVLLGPALFLIIYLIYKNSGQKKRFKMLAYAVLALMVFIVIFNFIAANYLNYIDISKFVASSFSKNTGETAHSALTYLDKSFSQGRFNLSSRTYWISTSNFFRGNLVDGIINAIWIIEAAAALGIVRFLLSGKSGSLALPQKKCVIFFLAMILALQIGIRFVDWRFFQKKDAIEFATSGRYYLPNLVSHLLLVAGGIGALFKKEKFLELFLKLALIALFFLSVYLIFMRIIPCYYF